MKALTTELLHQTRFSYYITYNQKQGPCLLWAGGWSCFQSPLYPVFPHRSSHTKGCRSIFPRNRLRDGESRLQVTYWVVSLRGCEGSRTEQKVKFSCNAVATEALGDVPSLVAFRDVPHGDKTTKSLSTTLARHWMWAAPGGGPQP